MTLILDALFSSVALGHFAVDLLNGQRAIIFTYLSSQLGLSNTLLGFFSTVYVVAGAAFQPVFGFAADRIGVRWVVVGGMLWMAVFYSLALITPGQTAFWLLALATLGSAAFHPAGVKQATLRGRTFYAGRETTSAAYFFFFGQAGYFLGPVVAGPILDRFGMLGLIWMVGIVGMVGLNASRQLGLVVDFRTPIPSPLEKAASIALRNGWRKKALPLFAFALVAAFQAWSQQNITTFMPKYLSDLGQSASVYGLIVAIFVGGSAIGGALGGILADRFGKRSVAVASLALASIPLFLVSALGWSPWYYLLIPLAGGLTGAVHSILVVLAQRAIPGGMAMASGLILGFMFTSGALGTLLCGYLADKWGFPPVFMLTAGIALVASLLALTLRKN